jgi:hypothetical protein
MPNGYGWPPERAMTRTKFTSISGSVVVPGGDEDAEDRILDDDRVDTRGTVTGDHMTETDRTHDDDPRMADYVARAQRLENAIFDAIAAQGAAPDYLTPSAVRFLVAGVLIDLVGRFFTVGVDEDVNHTARARSLAMIDQLRHHVLTYRPAPAPTRH